MQFLSLLSDLGSLNWHWLHLFSVHINNRPSPTLSELQSLMLSSSPPPPFFYNRLQQKLNSCFQRNSFFSPLFELFYLSLQQDYHGTYFLQKGKSNLCVMWEALPTIFILSLFRLICTKPCISRKPQSRCREIPERRERRREAVGGRLLSGKDRPKEKLSWQHPAKE